MEEQRRVAQVEAAKQRCSSVIAAIHQLPRGSTYITDSCRRTLLKSARAELAFLSRPSSSSTPLSVNIGHLEAVVYILQQPFITGVSRVCKSIPLLPSATSNEHCCSSLKDIHVDIVCTLNRKPVWILVSDRNPKYISWNRCHRSKGLKLRVEQVLAAARSTLCLRPSSVVLFFANGLANHVCERLRDEFAASEIGLEFSVFSSVAFEETEGDWINVIARSYKDACVLEINPAVLSSQSELSVAKAETQVHLLEENAKKLGLSVQKAEVRSEPAKENADTNLGDTFCSVVLGMKQSSLNNKNSELTKPENPSSEGNLVNFDTTALIAFVSGISNGGTKKLLATPESELRQRFKGNYDFVLGQIMSELESPIHAQFGKILCEKTGIICESVHMEFKELVLMCGGPNEKLRAEKLINCLRVVPDTPSNA